MKEHNTKSEEHIIPESLGCPSNAILRNGEVCEKCNKWLGRRIDIHIKDAFDIITFQHNITRKKGKSPVIRSRGNLRAEYINGKPNYYINTGVKAVNDSMGNILAGFNKGKSRHINASFDRNGQNVTVKFSVNIGDNIGFVRGLFKIALGALALQMGVETAIDSSYNSVRNFILKGQPILRCISTKEEKLVVENRIFPLWERDGFYLVAFRLFGIDFLCDLSPNQEALKDLIPKFHEVYGQKGWTYYPIDSCT